jgi:hypothetical protein
MQGRHRVIPRLESLETREAPSVTPWISQSFDTTSLGSIPAGWASWSNGAGGFQVSTAHALSGSNGLTSSSSLSSADARAWSTTLSPANASASAAVFVDSLIPARVLVRGSGLDTNSPSYYAVAVSRGLQLQLLRVVNGVTTVLGSINSQSYFSGGWLQISISANGANLSAQVYRPDQGLYLDSNGRWTATASSALNATDATLTQGGLAGVERASSYIGALTLDNFSVTALDGTQSPPRPARRLRRPRLPPGRPRCPSRSTRRRWAFCRPGGRAGATVPAASR